MPSFRTTLTPSKRAAARFVVGVRKAIQKGFADEAKRSGLTQTAMASAIGVHRSVINRELRGASDMTLGRVAELAWTMGFEPRFELRRPTPPQEANIDINRNAAPAIAEPELNRRLLKPVAA